MQSELFRRRTFFLRCEFHLRLSRGLSVSTALTLKSIETLPASINAVNVHFVFIIHEVNGLFGKSFADFKTDNGLLTFNELFKWRRLFTFLGWRLLRYPQANWSIYSCLSTNSDHLVRVKIMVEKSRQRQGWKGMTSFYFWLAYMNTKIRSTNGSIPWREFIFWHRLSFEQRILKLFGVPPNSTLEKIHCPPKL